MAPGKTSLEEMIASTERGLYITRFWYTRLVHPSDCIITGMTRDGVFMIENGEIVYPVKNLRFTQSYLEALNNVELIGRETLLLKSEFGSHAKRVPALKLSSFKFAIRIIRWMILNIGPAKIIDAADMIKIRTHRNQPAHGLVNGAGGHVVGINGRIHGNQRL